MYTNQPLHKRPNGESVSLFQTVTFSNPRPDTLPGIQQALVKCTCITKCSLRTDFMGEGKKKKSMHLSSTGDLQCYQELRWAQGQMSHQTANCEKRTHLPSLYHSCKTRMVRNTPMNPSTSICINQKSMAFSVPVHLAATCLLSLQPGILE